VRGHVLFSISSFIYRVSCIPLASYLEDVINLTKHRTSGGRATSKMSQAELDAMRKSIEGHGVREFEAVNTVMSLTRSEVIDYTLLGATVSYLLDQSDDQAGAVLVFTTGVAEIRRAIDAINEASGSKKVQTLPLHANLHAGTKPGISTAKERFPQSRRGDERSR
jgi:ATP-dependent RNA helicase DHX57